ncbi:5-formyltetrahydrofolate cyclo-ligase [soil metagenome]
MKAALRGFLQKAAASQAIRETLFSLAAWQSASIIYGYIPMASEPDWLARTWPEGKTLAFPRTDEAGGMQFFCSQEFQIGPWKAHEPVGEKLAPEPDLILVPGLAFDRQGHRMGRGGGFYDRWLEEYPSVQKIGLCFSCQLVELVPTEAHDARMDLVVTESGCFQPEP